jgi:hypothetical protein
VPNSDSDKKTDNTDNAVAYAVGSPESIDKSIVDAVPFAAKAPKADPSSSDPFKRRRVVVFWLVNPEKRIVSTADVEPMQGTISLQETKKNRHALMKERKYYKQEWNEREISLCEH